MGFEEIVEHIKREENAKTNKILTEARITRDKIINEAKAEAVQIVNDGKKKVQQDREKFLEESSASINVEAERLYGGAVNMRVSNSMRLASGALVKYSATRSYDVLLRALIKRAVAEIGEDATVYARERDVKRLGPYPKTLKLARLPSKFSGGIKVVSADGFREIDFSLESLLNKVKDRVAEKLVSRMED
jgi:vacuolar-type H+-ATPase subunit E/Vma4